MSKLRLFIAVKEFFTNTLILVNMLDNFKLKGESINMFRAELRLLEGAMRKTYIDFDYSFKFE